MATIHLIDGKKGYVGKSFVDRTMIQYCLDRNLSFTAVETDKSNPDVAGVYKKICQYAIFRLGWKQAYLSERIFDMGIKKPVIISFYSQINRATKTWIDRNQLLIIASEHDVRFCKWFVCNGEYDSIKLFLASLNCYKDQITHILVRT